MVMIIFLNENNHIFKSILLKYSEECNMLLTKESDPEASYFTKKHFDPIRFIFVKKEATYNYGLIEYVYDIYGFKRYKYFIKKIKKTESCMQKYQSRKH